MRATTPRELATKLAASIGALALLSGACSSDEPTSTGLPSRAGCDELADEVADLVVDLADHAASSAAGLPLGALGAEHPDEVDIWEVAAALAAGSAELEARVDAVATLQQEAGCEPGWAHRTVERRFEQELSGGREHVGENVDPEEYTALNLLAILAANLAPPPERYEVPEGFPAEFPVHRDAELASSERHDDGSVAATWVMKRVSFEEVSAYYSERLQEVRFGGWNVLSSSGSGGGNADGTEEGREHLTVEGYGFAGQVTIETGGNADEVVVIAELRRRD